MFNLLKNLQFTILSHLSLQDLLSFAQTNKYWSHLVFSENFIQFKMMREYPELWKSKPDTMTYKFFYQRILASGSLYWNDEKPVKLCDNIVDFCVKDATYINDIYGNFYKIKNMENKPIDFSNQRIIAKNVRKCYVYWDTLYWIDFNNYLYRGRDVLPIAKNVKDFNHGFKYLVYLGLDDKLYYSHNVGDRFKVLDENVQDYSVLSTMEILTLNSGQIKLFFFFECPHINTNCQCSVLTIPSITKIIKNNLGWPVLKTKNGDILRYNEHESKYIKDHIVCSNHELLKFKDQVVLSRYGNLFLLEN